MPATTRWSTSRRQSRSTPFRWTRTTPARWWPRSRSPTPDTSYDVDDITLSGPDADLFRVIADGSTGFQLALKPGEALDYEAATLPSVTVIVGGIESDPLTLDVQDLDDTSIPSRVPTRNPGQDL